jgi:1-acyl-sn-glycerol-3-phosphate acyltransferase
MSPKERIENQFGLLRLRRFAPFYFTQFLGAFNDNVFKNVLVLSLAFYSVDRLTFSVDLLTNAAALLFILPFFLFSATAGQLADKYDKAFLIRRVKTVEILIMLAAAVALWMDSLVALFAILFLMGSQSAFFGPAKFALLPQHLHPEELVGGNAQVEAGTFAAIILGLIVANLITSGQGSAVLIGATVVFLAILGRFSSGFIPPAPAPTPDLKINWNFWQQTLQLMRFARESHTVFHGILGVSWFWFLGSALITQVPVFTVENLQGTPNVMTLVLCLFSIGIAVGSLMCERFSGHKVEIGLVPFGALGISIFALDLYFALPLPQVETARGIQALLQTPGALHVLIDLVLIGVFSGLFIVPMFAMVQQRSKAEHRAQVIAATNVINSLFMVAAAIVGVLLLGVAGLNVPEFFAVLALMNLAVAWFIFTRVPEFAMRFIIWLVSHTMYRVKHENLAEIPEQGAAVIVCNHVSYMDALLLAGACRRPIRFVMYKPIYDLPVLNFVFRTGKAIPLISPREDAAAYEEAMDEIDAALAAGDLICLFPEGKLTRDGAIDEFKPGIERILERRPVPVVPMALQGLWGSFFSHSNGHALTKWPRRFWSRVAVVAGSTVEGEDTTAQNLRMLVAKLRGSRA